MKVAIYLRVSSEEQRERQSIATQREFAARYCELHELTTFAVYEDDGVTGTIPLEQRPAGLRLLQDAGEKRFDTVFVYKVDRLARTPRHILNAVAELEELGAQVKSMTEPFDTSTPAGRFLLTILSGVAGLERDNILERSRLGTDRLAREGAWLGGIVPYGYRVEGKDKAARLVVAEEPIPGIDLSEADVIRLIYQLTVEEHLSCVQIADRLNALRVPPAYARDGRQVLRGKRKTNTQGLWRPGRVRNMIVNTTYKGLHGYGQRSTKQREVIWRQVPAIVEEDTWNHAQLVLRGHFLFGKRNAHRQYLLRGMLKCGLCGLTYIGSCYPVKGSTRNESRAYYTCNGKHGARGLYGKAGKKCPAIAVSGKIEERIWEDVELFLRNPGEVLEKLAEKMQEQSGEASVSYDQVRELQRALAGMMAEKDAVLGLFRKGRIDGAALDRQLDDIAREEEGIRRQLEAIQARVQSAEQSTTRLRTAEALLRELNLKLDGEVTWETKRQMIEILVESARVYPTADERGKQRAQVAVKYYFGPPTVVDTRRGRGSWLQ